MVGVKATGVLGGMLGIKWGATQRVEAGDPSAAWAEAILARGDPSLPIGSIAAPGFLEDMQVVSHLRGLLEARGVRGVLGHACHVHAREGHARFTTSEYAGPVGALVRFHQAEWLARLRHLGSIEGLFVGGLTPVTAPGTAVFTESKRLPLLWDRLKAPSTAFREAMPESRDPRAAPWMRHPDEWVLKGTYSNTGDEVVFPEALTRSARLALVARVLARPTRWVAQRRFTTAAVPTPFGDARLCIGVYAVEGRAAGAYVRLATRAIVDGAAIDAPLLVEN
jgi:hypothetical protein